MRNCRIGKNHNIYMNKTLQLRALLGSVFLALSANCALAQSASLEADIERLFRISEEHNASIQSFRAATAEAEASHHEAKAARLPEISAEASVSYLSNGKTWNRKFGDAHKAPIPHFGNNFALRAQQVVYAGGAINGGIGLAKQAKQMAQLSEKENTQHVRFLLVGLYLQLHNLNNCKQVYDANAVLTDTVISMMHRRHKQGMLLKNDVTRYELEREQVLLGSTRMNDQMRIVRHELLTALGTENADISLLDEKAFSNFSFALGKEEDWQHLALEHHLGLRKSELGIAMNRTKEKLARAERRPKIVLFAEDNLNGPITIEVPAIDRNFNYWYAGLGVSYNFSSLYKAKRSIKKAEAATAHAGKEHNVALENVESAIHSAYVDCQTAQAEVRTQEKRVELAEQNYFVVSERYTNDLALITDLTDAANTKLDAELALVSARINLIYCYYKLRYTSSTL